MHGNRSPSAVHRGCRDRRAGLRLQLRRRTGGSAVLHHHVLDSHLRPPDRADRATEDADLAVVTKIFATDPPGLQSGQQAVIARTAADGDLVAVHWHETADPAQPWTGRAHIDPYRLAGGKIVEQWDVVPTSAVAPTTD